MTAATTSPTTAQTSEFFEVPLAGLEGQNRLRFPLYLVTGPGTPILYSDSQAPLGEDQLNRLRRDGVSNLLVRRTDRPAYFGRVEGRLGELVHDSRLALAERASMLHGVAGAVASDLLSSLPTRKSVQRARRLMAAAAELLLREPRASGALRVLLDASADLKSHSLTVGFLSLALAEQVLHGRPLALLHAGLAGLLHDVGKIGHEECGGDDPEHVRRGAALLFRLGLPQEVCEASLAHHEHVDGSGYPRGLIGEELPPLAKIVGIVDTFVEILATRLPEGAGVFDGLQILATVYRGCFDEDMARALVRMFGR